MNIPSQTLEPVGCAAAVAGRRPDTSAHEGRFPAEASPRVMHEIQEVLASNHVHTVFCSAAAGVDLLALKAAQALGIRQLVVLPFSVELFRKSSVADRGVEWTALFDETIGIVEAVGDLVVLRGVPGADAAYRQVNHEILERARSAMRANHPAVSPVAIAAWDGKRRTGNDLTSEFIEEAKREGFRYVEILTTGAPGWA